MLLLFLTAPSRIIVDHARSGIGSANKREGAGAVVSSIKLAARAETLYSVYRNTFSELKERGCTRVREYPSPLTCQVQVKGVV